MEHVLSRQNIIRLFALSSLVQRINGQVLQGCAAVDFLNRYEDMLSTTCQVEETDMRLIDLLSTTSRLLHNDLTWTIGDSGLQTTIEEDERTVTRSFYIGTPASLNLSSPELSVRGCAIFVISPDTGAYQVYDQGAPQYINTASCAGSVGATYVSDLTVKVEGLARSSFATNTNDFCNSMAEGVREPPPPSYYILSQHPRIQAISLTGPDAPRSLTTKDNSTSNCWPTLPKTNNLTKIFEYDHVAQLTEWVPWLGYTPLITVFTSGNATTDVEVDVTCMKIIDSDDSSKGTARNGTNTTIMEEGTTQRSAGWRIFVLIIGIWSVVLV
jgi:hypothetical protein